MLKPLDNCVNKLGRKPKDYPIVHAIWKLSNVILGKQILIKYGDFRNPVVTIQIEGNDFPNTLVDLRSSINIITLETYGLLGLTRFKLSPTMLELADKPIVKLEGTFYDITIFVDS